MYGSRATEGGVFFMRKIIIVLVLLTAFSFSMVYAQGNYGLDINKNKVEKAKATEKKAEINTGQKEAIKKEEENKEEVEKKEETSGETAPKTEEKQETKNNGDAKKATVKNGQASPVKKQVSNSTKNSKSTTTTSTVKKETPKQSSNTSKPKEAPKKEPAKETAAPVIDTSKANSGSFRAKGSSNKKLKVMVVKGSEKYTYDLKGNNTYQSYPLQLGDGLYKLSIMENIEGTRYKYLYSKEVTVKTSNPNAKYLTSVQMINWNNSMGAIKKAKAIAGSGSDKQKASKIYSYVVSAIKYDTSITSLKSGYVPSINKTYSSKKGICYDFASITAGMLRSVGVPTRLIKGTSNNVNGYHAWNEVLIGGKWYIIDTSYDSQMRQAGHGVSMFKSGKDYSRQKVY